jgi:hypothetical protein
MYTAAIFNTQSLLFDKTRSLENATTKQMPIPLEYYERGWAVIDGIADALEAVEVQEDFVRSIDPLKLPLQASLASRIKLAKADQIPVCDDIVATSFQVLHFDMGQPFVESKDQLLVTHVGIYLPKDTSHNVTARTRVVELEGLLKDFGLAADAIENKVMTYAYQHGDGWAGHNTFRLACFARFIDALSDTYELASEIDKTVGQWFQNDQKLDAARAYEQEAAFYKRHGVDLKQKERQIKLKPGQLLILDNMRVVHGRIGTRKAKELYNFMFGIRTATPDDIVALRSHVAELVT